MKKLSTTLVFLFSTIMLISAQSITPVATGEFCPNTEYTFSVTIPAAYISINTSAGVQITQYPYGFNQAQTSFSFKAKFTDVNQTQNVIVAYSNTSFTFAFKKVESLFAGHCGTITPSPSTISAPLCQTSNFTVSFTNLKWKNNFENPQLCFADITSYQYLLPAGWKLNSTSSDGSTWIAGGNPATVTSDLSTGNGGTIQVRAYNNCANVNSAYYGDIYYIPISRASSFNITSSINSMVCGATAPVTFTVNNPNNVSGITGYVWNLGTSSNGWLHNGSAAPATIPTTTNTLTLTPVCGSALSPVSASVTVGSASCNTNAATITISNPTATMFINGNTNICSGSATYTLSNLPCNAGVSWTASPSGIVTPTSSTSISPSFTKVADGNVTLSASVTACGNALPVVTRTIKGGSSVAADYTMTGNSSSIQPLYWCPNQTYAFAVNGAGSGYVWSQPAGWTINYQSNYLNVIKAPSSSYPPTGDVSVTFTEPCNTSVTKTFFTAYSPSACTGTDPRFTFSPNPAPSYLNVSVASGYTGTVFIRRVQIVRISTGIVVFDQSYGASNSSAYITTSGFQTGSYNLRVYDGTNWSAYQFTR